MGVSDFRRFAAAGRAVWPIGHAVTAASSGWILGPELTLTRTANSRYAAFAVLHIPRNRVS
eukprot:2829401-Alexandrium_andersonii.AAC.1